MRLKNTKIIVLQKTEVKDGLGGYTEEFVRVKELYVDLFNMTTNKQLNSFGEISKTALTIISNNKIDKENYIEFDGDIYKIIYNNKVFKRYTYDLEIFEDV